MPLVTKFLCSLLHLIWESSGNKIFEVCLVLCKQQRFWSSVMFVRDQLRISPCFLLSLCTGIGKRDHPGWSLRRSIRMSLSWTMGGSGPWVMSYRLEVFIVSEVIPGCWIRRGDNTSKDAVSPEAKRTLSSGRGQNACLACRGLCCQLNLCLRKIN